MKRILISGAGIAGPVLGYWLNKAGFQVTIIEIEKDLRTGGQNIDITDAGRDVLKLMGIEGAVRDNFTGEKGLRFVDHRGKVKAEFPKDSEISFTRDLEILRGDLVKILFDFTKDDISYKFGCEVIRLNHEENQVNVTFNDNSSDSYDCFIAADGMGSSSRKLIFGNDMKMKYLGIWTSYFTVERTDYDDDWAKWYNAPDGVVVLLRPDNKASMRASVNYLSDNSEYQPLSVDEKREKLVNVLSNKGWECDRLVQSLKKKMTSIWVR
ncbi:MAG: hypothetical protein CL565_02490 [Alphaproteobacteria bacterium]|nr:hypothetical protein [Alphaproteobacteria bacterium]